jgi:hypothetical protein
MLFNKRLLQLVAAGLLLLFPAALFAAAFRLRDTGTDAIDTLTVESGSAGGLASAGRNVGRIIFQTDNGDSPTATRNKIVAAAEVDMQLDCALFRVQPLGVDRFQIDATGGSTILSVKLRGIEIPVGPDSVVSNGGQTFRRDDAGQNAPLPPCEKPASLSFYGLIALALILAGLAVWMFRKRKMGLA